MDIKAITRRMRKYTERFGGEDPRNLMNYGAISPEQRRWLEEPEEAHRIFCEYITACLPHGGVKVGDATLLGTHDIYSYNHASRPMEWIRPFGFYAIGTTGRGNAKSEVWDNVVVLDLEMDRVYWVNHKLFSRKRIKALDEKTGKAMVLEGYSRENVLRALTPLCETLEEFLLAFLQGGLSQRLSELEVSTGKPDETLSALTAKPSFSIFDAGVSDPVRQLVKADRLGEAIQLVEAELRKIAETPFHVMLGLSLLDQTQAAAQWLRALEQAVRKKFEPKAIYCEIAQEFEINLNARSWSMWGCAYKEHERSAELNWLSCYDFAYSKLLPLKGLGKLRKAFGLRCRADEKEAFSEAGTLVMFLVVLRAMELMQAAVASLRLGKSETAAGIPVLVSSHEWDLIHVNR